MRKLILVITILIALTALPASAYKPSDPLYAGQANYLDQINIESAWDVAKGKGVVVAVLDSGVDVKHPDLKFNIFKNTNEIPGDGIDNDENGYIDDVSGWDFIDGDNLPLPEINEGYSVGSVNHGTAVSGLISAVGNNAKGITGIAFRSKIMPIRVLDGDGVGDVSTLVLAIKYAVENGADIINLSLVGYDYSPDLDFILEWAYGRGVLVVAAAGNAENENLNGINLDNLPAYPACYGNNTDNNVAFAVSSVNSKDKKSKFSNYGMTCVDISAPGENLNSLGYYNQNNDDFKELYVSGLSGTSFSTALVSGVSALLKSKTPSLDPEQIIYSIKKNAEDIDNINAAYADKIGSGRLDAAQTLHFELVTEKGYLASLKDSNDIFYVDTSGVKHLFENKEVLTSWYASENQIKTLSFYEFDNLVNGSRIGFRPGVNLIKFKNSPEKIYAITPGSRLCRVQEKGALKLYGDKWRYRVKVVDGAFEDDYRRDINCVLDEFSRYPDGSLIQYQGSDIIYYIEGQKKRQIIGDGFVANEFHDSVVIKNVSSNISYTNGQPISSQEIGILKWGR